MLKRNSDPNSTRTRTDDGGDDDRTERGSVWDVPVDWRNNFWVIFSLLMLAAAAFETWFDFEYGTAPTPLHRFRAIIWSTVQYMAPAAPIAIFLTEGIRVLSEKYLRKRYRDGLRTMREWVERRDNAIAAGIPFNEPPPGGQAPAARSVNGNGANGTQAILDWVERRDAANAAGIPFDEPPPDPAKIVSQTNGSANGSNGSAKAATATAKPETVPNSVDVALADLSQWYVRKGIAEDMGVPFNEPHPIRSNGNGTV